MRFQYLSHMQAAKDLDEPAQIGSAIRAFAVCTYTMKGQRQRLRLKFTLLGPLAGYVCMFKE